MAFSKEHTFFPIYFLVNVFLSPTLIIFAFISIMSFLDHYSDLLCDFSFKVGRALVKKKFLKKTLSNRIVRGDRGEYSAVP